VYESKKNTPKGTAGTMEVFHILWFTKAKIVLNIVGLFLKWYCGLKSGIFTSERKRDNMFHL